MTVGQQWLSADDVARMFGVSVDTIYDMVHRRVIPHGRFGRRLVFQQAEVEHWVRQQADEPIVTLPNATTTTVVEPTPEVASLPVEVPRPRTFKKGSRKDLFG